jgi:hypothetical protein
MIKSSPPNLEIDFTGDIVDGDTLELKKLIVANVGWKKIMVNLNSRGGLLKEAIELGQFFREWKITTRVPNAASCASACAIAFFGGYDGDLGRPFHIKSSGGQLGVHQFRVAFKDGNYTKETDGEKLR